MTFQAQILTETHDMNTQKQALDTYKETMVRSPSSPLLLQLLWKRPPDSRHTEVAEQVELLDEDLVVLWRGVPR